MFGLRFCLGGTTKVLLQYLDIPMGGDVKPLDIHHGRFWRSMHSINNRAPRPSSSSRALKHVLNTSQQLLRAFKQLFDAFRCMSSAYSRLSSQVLKRILGLHDYQKESSTLPQILADFVEAEAERQHSSASLDAPVSYISRRATELLERQPHTGRRQNSQLHSLFGTFGGFRWGVKELQGETEENK